MRQDWIAEIIRPYLTAALGTHEGNISATARALRAPLRSLQKWVIRLGLTDTARVQRQMAEMRAHVAKAGQSNHSGHTGIDQGRK